MNDLLWHRFCAAQIPILEELMSWVRTQRALRKQVREGMEDRGYVQKYKHVLYMGVRTCVYPGWVLYPHSTSGV